MRFEDGVLNAARALDLPVVIGDFADHGDLFNADGLVVIGQSGKKSVVLALVLVREDDTGAEQAVFERFWTSVLCRRQFSVRCSAARSPGWR